MRSLSASILALALAIPATPAAAQGGAVAGLGAIYHTAHRNIVAAAEQMPEEHYGFKPTPEVRSFGELIGHIAGANYMICAMAAGEQSPSRENFEKTTAKAALVTAVKASFEYCNKVYLMDDAKGMEPMELFGQKTNRLGVLAFNAGHDMEHYGNIVTYMRMKGLVPPSSQR